MTTTRPENLGGSSKGKRHQILQLHRDLLPGFDLDKPALSTSILNYARLSRPKIQAVYDQLTKSVSVHSEQDMVTLWRRGFFGKGSLSRSEPSWSKRVQNRIDEAHGKEHRMTSEEVTAQRRKERIVYKHSKKLERDAERLLAAENSVRGISSEKGSSLGSPITTPAVELEQDEAVGLVEESKEEKSLRRQTAKDPSSSNLQPPAPSTTTLVAPPTWHLTAEHTQLQSEEAFFLLFALGALSISSVSPLTPDTPPVILTILQAWQQFLLDSSILSLSSSIPRSLSAKNPALSRFDSPFLVSYAVYHHYRSMGWVIRSGVKFCVDWVLYGQTGPVGSHAEFAVIVQPNYVDPEDEKTNPFRSWGAAEALGIGLAEGETKNSWRYFNTVNRVCSGVKKTLVLLQVLIPPLSSLPSEEWISDNPAQTIARFQMREVTVRRWLPGRMRE